MSSRRKLGPGEIANALAACLTLGAAWLAVRFLPFRMIVQTLGWGGDRSEGDAPWAQKAADELVRAVVRASRRVPWRTVCIHQGIALHWMLRSRGIASQLHYGVGRGDDRLSAHVWVSLAGRILVGEAEAAAHACVATFPARPA